MWKCTDRILRTESRIWSPIGNGCRANIADIQATNSKAVRRVITYNWKKMKSRSNKELDRLKACEVILPFPDMIALASEGASISGLGTLL